MYTTYRRYIVLCGFVCTVYKIILVQLSCPLLFTLSACFYCDEYIYILDLNKIQNFSLCNEWKLKPLISESETLPG